MTTATRRAAPAGATSPRLSSASHALPGRSCASDVPGKSHAWTLPWCGVPSVISGATLRGAVPAQVRAAPRARPCCGRRSRRARRRSPRGSRRSSRRPGRRRARSTPAAGRSSSCRRDRSPRAARSLRRPRIDARVAQHAVQQQDRRAGGRGRGIRASASDRAPCCGPDAADRAHLVPEEAERSPRARSAFPAGAARGRPTRARTTAT